MAIWDGDQGPVNIPFPTLGGEVFWDDLDCAGGYTLQQHRLTGHCRLLDENNVRVAWGEEGPMRARLRSLTEGGPAPRDMLNLPLPTLGGGVFWDNLLCAGGYTLQRNKATGHCRLLDENNVRVAWGEEDAVRARLHALLGRTVISPRCGDVIGVHRAGGLYDHYGVYQSDQCVYEYASDGGDFGNPSIRTATLRGFIRDAGNCFILEFPEEYGPPGKVDIFLPPPALPHNARGLDALAHNLKQLAAPKEYRLYSPEETVRRARSRLGENQYHLIWNNCEHFAIWCKTGLRESHQIQAILDFLDWFPAGIRLGSWGPLLTNLL